MLGRGSTVPPPEPWPTGVSVVDRLSGLGGLPRGRVSVLSGATGSGKLSLALALLASATQQLSGAVVVDVPHRFDPWALLPFEPDLAALTVARPPDAPCAAEASISLARAGVPFLLVFLWDGLGASSNWLGALESAASRTGTVVLWATDSVPAPLAHASSFSLTTSRTGWTWERGQLVGIVTHVSCVKNKVSAIAGMSGMETEAELQVRYPLGADLFPDAVLDEHVDKVAKEVEPWVVRSAAV